MPNIKNRIGERHGRLIVIERAEDFICKNSGRKCVQWKCLCDCGNYCIVAATSLQTNATQSCGCLNREVAHINRLKKTIHGETGTRLYRIWHGIKTRCYASYAQDKEKKNYQEKGIIMCEEWKNDYVTFRNWALNNGYADNLSIDRIDNNGNYEPSNCRWVDNKTQQNNKNNNTIITWKGITHTQSEWSEITGLSRYTIHDRIEKGWDLDRVFLQPAKHTNKSQTK